MDYSLFLLYFLSLYPELSLALRNFFHILTTQELKLKAYATKVGVYPWQFLYFSVGVKASPIFVMALIHCIVCTWWWKSASKDERNIIPGLFPSVLLHCKSKHIRKQCIM